MAPSTEAATRGKRSLWSANALVMCASALGATLVGGLVSRGLLRSLNDSVPSVEAALVAHPDALVPMPSEPTTRVVMIVLDGVGGRILEPLGERGDLGPLAAVLRVETGLPSLSRPGYHVLLTGVPQPVSGIRANDFTRARADSVVDRIHAAGGTAAFVQESVPWFGEMFGGPSDVVANGAWAGGVPAFRQAYDSGASLIVVHLTGADNAGHGSGAASVAYRWTVDRQVEAINALVFSVKETSSARATHWLVGADHGHTQAGGHGGPEPEVSEVSWLLLATGKNEGVRAAAPSTRLPATVIAPFVSSLLGVQAPRHALAIAPALPPAIAMRSIPASALVERNTAVDEARRSHEAYVRRRVGFTAVGLVLAGLAGLARLHTRTRVASITPVLAAVLAFGVLGPGFTLSAIHSERAYLQTVVACLAGGALVCWPAARMAGATITATIAVSLGPALAALALTAGSLGQTEPGPIATLLLASTGLLPPGVTLGVLGGEALCRIRERLRATTR
jgi:hypothetical protein